MLVCDYCNKEISTIIPFIGVKHIEVISRTRAGYGHNNTYGDNPYIAILHKECFNKLFIFRDDDGRRRESCVCGHLAYYNAIGEYVEVNTFYKFPDINMYRHFHKAHFLKYWMGKPF